MIDLSLEQALVTLGIVGLAATGSALVGTATALLLVHWACPPAPPVSLSERTRTFPRSGED